MNLPMKATDTEKTVYDWIIEQRESEMAVSVRYIIEKAFSHDSSFTDEYHINHFHCVYLFILQWKLNIHMTTRTSQKLTDQFLV